MKDPASAAQYDDENTTAAAPNALVDVVSALADSDPSAFELEALRPNGPDGSTPLTGTLSVLHGVAMEVTVELGRTTMPIRELLALQPGMVVEVDRSAGTPIDVLVNGRRVASGEVVVIDEEFGIRITEIVAPGSGH